MKESLISLSDYYRESVFPYHLELLAACYYEVTSPLTYIFVLIVDFIDFVGLEKEEY